MLTRPFFVSAMAYYCTAFARVFATGSCQNCTVKNVTQTLSLSWFCCVGKWKFKWNYFKSSDIEKKGTFVLSLLKTRFAILLRTKHKHTHTHTCEALSVDKIKWHKKQVHSCAAPLFFFSCYFVRVINRCPHLWQLASTCRRHLGTLITRVAFCAEFGEAPKLKAYFRAVWWWIVSFPRKNRLVSIVYCDWRNPRKI